MKFPESFINEIIDRNDIVDVVGSYVALNKRSGSNMFGLCPFHNEKTPSFSVSPDKQIFHCFGCGKGGGVISFIMEEENLSFPEAVELLAKRAGLAMPTEDGSGEGKRRARMYQLNKDAAMFFYEKMLSEDGNKAKQYMNRRKITPITAKNFGLGYAPDTWDSLLNAMKAKGYSELELFDADLVRKGKNGGYYDTFRDRLMFPVIDVKGSVIGFSGRILGDREPKYLNTKETLVFNKGNNLFGLNLAKKSKSGKIILVEGNVDVVSLHQAGFDCAVASLGTSLTPGQAQLISRYVKEVVIAYDNDGAGLKASQRAINILESLDVKVKVLRMNGAKDPDEFIKLNGDSAFRKLLSDSESQIDYRLKNIQEKYDLSIADQKVAFLKEATRLIATFPNEVQRNVYGGKLADIAKINEESIQREISIQRKRMLNNAKKGEFKSIKPSVSAQPKERKIKYEDIESAKAEEGVIRLIYLEPELCNNISIKKEDFSSEVLGKIFEVILEKSKNHSAINPDYLAEDLSTDEISLLIEISQSPETLSKASDTITDYIKKILDRKDAREKTTDLKTLAENMMNNGKGYRK